MKPNCVAEISSHQRDKHLGCNLYRILGKTLEMDLERTSTNGPESKKEKNLSGCITAYITEMT